MDGRAHGDVAEGKRVARPDLGPHTAHERVPDPDLVRGEDVALLAVHVVQQRDAGVAVRVVLDMGDLGSDPVLLPAEVHDAVLPLVTPAAAS